MPKLEIVVTPAAETDMLSIFDFIVQDNISKANQILNIFEEKFDMISDFPQCGISYAKVLKRDARCLVVAKHYQIFYKEKNGVIYILRILTGYQDINNLL